MLLEEIARLLNRRQDVLTFFIGLDCVQVIHQHLVREPAQPAKVGLCVEFPSEPGWEPMLLGPCGPVTLLRSGVVIAHVFIGACG